MPPRSLYFHRQSIGASPPVILYDSYTTFVTDIQQSVPVCAFIYYKTVGHWPDFTNPEDQAKIGTEVVAFVTLARFAVPVRIGLALFSVPFIQENVVDKFKKEEEDNCTIEE